MSCAACDGQRHLRRGLAGHRAVDIGAVGVDLGHIRIARSDDELIIVIVLDAGSACREELDVAVHGIGVDDLAGHNIGQLCDEIVLVKLLLHLLAQRLEILGRERQAEALCLQRALVELERQGRIEMDLRVNARACDAAVRTSPAVLPSMEISLESDVQANVTNG